MTGYRTRSAINNEIMKEPSFELFENNTGRCANAFDGGDIISYQYKQYDAPNGDLPKFPVKLPYEQKFGMSKIAAIFQTGGAVSAIFNALLHKSSSIKINSVCYIVVILE